MKDFFKSVRKHIGKLDGDNLREQYGRVADEVEFFERIFNTIDRGILTISPDGKVNFRNPFVRELLGMEPEDAVRQLDIPLGKMSKREFEITYPSLRQIEMTTTPMKNGDTLVVLRDITAEREHSEEELRAGATKAVCDLAAGVAHEIGNPLNAIALSLQLIRRDPTDVETIDTCMEQVKRLNGIVRDFLSAMRPQRPNLMPGSLAEPLKGCLASLKPQLEERRIQVTLDIPAALPNVALDAAQLQQVFFNLLKNALEAIRDGGRIAIALDADDQSVSATFRDNGAGMDAEQLAHLFEPYRTTKEKGAGLGLMVSKRIVTEHGGTIAAESAPGEGTAFTVTLPRLEKRVRQLGRG